jgi:hypothetical protein
VFNSGNSELSCYQCDSSIDDYCPESWNRWDLDPKPCEDIDHARFCVKTTGIYGGIVGTRRFCSSRNLDNACYEIQYPQDQRIYYSCTYTCGMDGCNFALKKFNTNNLLIISSFIVSALFSLF